MEPQRRRAILFEVAEIERRLGTPNERPEDFARCAFLVHEFNNALTKIQCEKTIAAIRAEAMSSGNSNPPMAVGDEGALTAVAV